MEKRKKMNILASSFEDIEEAIYKSLTKKYFFGVNLITGRSNLRSAIEILVELIIGVYLFIFLASKENLSNFPIKEITIAYFIKYCLTFIDTIVLVFTRVISFFDILMNIFDAGFWGLAYLVFKDYGQTGKLGEQMEFLYVASILRAVFILIYYTFSVFLFARDDAVSSIKS